MSKITVFVPKSAFRPDSRNGFAPLFEKIGYDKIAAGDFDRRSCIEQGDLIVQGMKSARNLAALLECYAKLYVGVLCGTDVFGEALIELSDRQQEVPAIETFPLLVGMCSLRIVAPEEQPITSPEDVTGRRIFTKYPLLLRELLKRNKVTADIRETESADVLASLYRDQMRVAALDTVGSGDTAQENALQIVKSQLEYGCIGPTCFESVRTDLFGVAGPDAGVSKRTRDALQKLGKDLFEAKRSLYPETAP